MAYWNFTNSMPPLCVSNHGFVAMISPPMRCSKKLLSVIVHSYFRISERGIPGGFVAGWR